jgi:DNA-directed RNA polymerase subunit N (RpoN/RPB10)
MDETQTLQVDITGSDSGPPADMASHPTHIPTNTTKTSNLAHSPTRDTLPQTRLLGQSESSSSSSSAAALQADPQHGLTAYVALDICCHLGFIRNVDLASRGFYFVEIQLCVGREDGTVIAPVRCFSCPSTIASKVRETQLQPAPLLHMCNIHDDTKAFQCRSFMVRYKGEVHELNDGCSWKYIMPAYSLEAFGGTAPKATEILLLKFTLMFADVADGVAGDMDTTPHLFVPDDPQWVPVAEQVLGLQGAGSGVHEYFPVSYIYILIAYVMKIWDVDPIR